MYRINLLGSKLMVLTNIISAVFPALLAVDPNCIYNQNLELGTTYYVYNKEYPSNYGQNVNCLWNAVAPPGYVADLSCNLEMPNTPGCVDDRLLVSRTGQEPNVQNSNIYCGYGNISVHSESTNISIALQSSPMSTRGRFLCTLKAIVNPSNPASCDCGWRNVRRIVGGVETIVNEYPMMAGLVDLQKSSIFCGATIIATRYAATAAHCWTNKDYNFVGLLVGDHNLTTGAETDKAALLQLFSVINHPEYNPNTKINDIAIVKTKTDIQYSWAVGPACLPFYYYQQSFEGQVVTALGWGSTEFTGPSSDVLLKTDLNVLSYSQCYNDVGGTINEMCTFRSGHDACQSDSGGPLIWQDQSSYKLYLIGVISYGYGCASSKPAVNTRVTSYLMWILSVTPDAVYCNKGPNSFKFPSL